MSDAIIAVVPAKGHEGLTAYGKAHPWCSAERPMLLIACNCGVWACRETAGGGHHRIMGPGALVLHAPGDPRLGMVRAQAAANCTSPSMWWNLNFGHHAHLPGASEAWTDAATRFADDPRRSAFSLARLLVLLGKASEVLVLPVAP